MKKGIVKRRGTTKPLTDEEKAVVWAMTDEGWSQRQVAEQLGIGPATVGAVLADDPMRLSALRARHNEERARQMIALRDLGVKVATKALRKMDKGLDDREMKASTLEKFTILPRVVTAAANASFGAEKIAALLTGRPTENINLRTPGADLNQFTDEQLVQMAVDSGYEECLKDTPHLVAMAERLKAERAKEVKP